MRAIESQRLTGDIDITLGTDTDRFPDLLSLAIELDPFTLNRKNSLFKQ